MPLDEREMREAVERLESERCELEAVWEELNELRRRIRRVEMTAGAIATVIDQVTETLDEGGADPWS